jgi:hypothetical protein
VRLGKRFAVRGRTAVAVIAEAFNLFNRLNFSEVNNIFGTGAYPAAPTRDAQGRLTYGLFEEALPPRQMQLALRFTFSARLMTKRHHGYVTGSNSPCRSSQAPHAKAQRGTPAVPGSCATGASGYGLAR